MAAIPANQGTVWKESEKGNISLIVGDYSPLMAIKY